MSNHQPTWLPPVQKQYFQMVPLRHFRWPTSLSLTEDSQTLLVNNTILSPIATKHPPSTTYSLRFLKTLLDLIETANEEAVDSLYETYVSLLATTQSNPAFITASTICHKTYFLPSQSTEPAHITLRETEATISNGTTGLRTWEAAIRFSEYILVNPSIVSSKRVIELGAGAGLLGLVCAHMGAKSVELTDVDSGVLNLLHQNIEINFPNLSQAGKCIPTVRRLDWETVTSESIRSMEADVVVCADVVYDPSIVPLLTKVIGTFLENGVEAVWIASTMRQPSTFELFLDHLRQGRVACANIQLDSVPEWFHHEEDHVVLMKLTREI